MTVYLPLPLLDNDPVKFGNAVKALSAPARVESLLETELCIPRQVALWRPMRSGKKVRAHRSHAISCSTCAFQISSKEVSSAALPWSSGGNMESIV